jgi:acyl-coenzyme A thioesterase PaaI-like protein
MKTLWRETLYIRLFGWAKVPLIYYVGPKVIEMSEERIEICIPLRRRTKNHMNCMYFGALSIGADLASGALAMHLIDSQKLKLSLLFKDFKADFLKRAEGDVHFICDEGANIKKVLVEASQSGERMNFPIRVRAVVPKFSKEESVAEFVLTMSLKRKSK